MQRQFGSFGGLSLPPATPIAVGTNDQQGNIVYRVECSTEPELVFPTAIALQGCVLFLPRAIETIRDACTQVPVEKTTIATAALGTYAGLAGAAQAWLARLANRYGIFGNTMDS